MHDELSNLFNESFIQSMVPDCLKKSHIIPIFKKGDINSMNNYRPIALITTISKILEKLMYNRLLDFASKSKLLSRCQHGFQKNRSTSSAMKVSIHKIYENLDKGNQVCGIACDFSKTFDSVNFEILGSIPGFATGTVEGNGCMSTFFNV